nr:sialoadhesin isoform X1 [Pogona vitticeps]XP_020650825.1 sialoadhesin isoform X1 [Pogona vitticeps]XP_020650826.1 sialoadhesin isoform X1 [Pogona vitticeps]XP_020650827.1 sialoadhesin isoform X1 [Pogona vitticeps]
MSALLFLLGLAHWVSQAFASWGATYPERLQAVKGSCVVIPCTFHFPSTVTVTAAGITAIWYKGPAGQRTVIFHSENPGTAEAQFRDRAELLGNPLQKNCTLLLKNVRSEDGSEYNFRFEISEGNRWTEQRPVQLTVLDNPSTPSITVPVDLHEGQQEANFTCSTLHFCPDHSSLRWTGYNAETSQLFEVVEEGASGVLQKQILKTALTWKDHNRKLGCELSLGIQKVTKEVTLHVKYAPRGVKVSLTPSAKNLLVGDAASLTCIVNSSYPVPTAYRWFKDGVASGGGRVKTFQAVARKDYGRYRCEAVNSVGTGVAEGVTLFVFSAELSISPSSSIREGETVTLTCDVPGGDKQAIHYSWYKNNIWMKEGASQSLVFQEVAVGDTGYYTCKVQNEQGSEMSQAVRLDVLYPPRSPSLTLFQETQEGQLAIIHCTADSNPQSTLSLYRENQLIATTSLHSAPNQRISITTTRNSLKLEIRKVIPEDKGNYQCTATNTYGSVNTTRFFGAQTARVVVQPAKELPEGDRVALTCTATLEPGEETTYTWYKNGKWLREGKESSLVFSAVTSDDAGAFHCVAQNKKGRNTSPAVALRVLYSPREPVMNSLLETQGGHLAIIGCTVDSDPPSEVALYKGDLLLGSTSTARSATDQRMTLTPSYNGLKVTIQNVTLEDEGEYVCSAQNHYGESTASMDFTAETAKVTITPSSEVLEGVAVRLSCAVSSIPSTLANITWFKGGRSLSMEDHREVLEFEQVARGDAGIYSCRVETLRASKSSNLVALSVLYPPGTPQVTVFVETERGRLALFQCSVDSNPAAKLVLRRGEDLIASSGSENSVASQRIRVQQARNSLQVEMKDLDPQDEGRYNLTAINAYGSSSTLLYLRVQTARVLVTPFPEVLEGSAVNLTCDVVGSSPSGTTFSWYKNSRRLQEKNSDALAFPRITSEDAGSYHCKAHGPEEGAVSISPPVSITVFYPPRSPQVTSFLQRQGREVAVLRCTVESEPQSRLAFSKRGELLASSLPPHPAHSQRVKVSSSYNRLDVEIWGVVLEDEGEYACSASNPYGQASSTLMFTAETARIWISPPDVLEGNSVNLTCAVDSNASSEAHYTWYKNNQRLSEGPSQMLTLPHANVADGGTYYCTVKTRERIRNSTFGTLNVLYPPRNAEMKSFLETLNGKVAIMICNVDSNPPSTLLLCQAGQVLAASAFQGSRVPGHRLSTVSSRNSLRLEIKEVSLDDEGTYECLASNAIGQTTASLDFTVRTARVVIQPASDVREGAHVSLTCEDLSSAPNVVYTWYKNSKWLSEGSAPSLFFPAVTTHDVGSYSCQVRSARGIRTSPPVPLRVLYAPKQPSLISFLETQSGNRAIIQCTVESHPPSEVALYRGNLLLASTRNPGTFPTQRLSVLSAHNSLKVEIEKILLEDEGQYHCLANNTYGNSTVSIHFSVESARINIDPSPDIKEGDSANLTCVVASRAMGEMNYTWYKNSRWLRESPDPSFLMGNVARGDAGSYHCQAAGPMGTLTSAFVSLNVLYAPRSPSMSAYLDNQRGKAGIIYCRVDSHPRSELALFKGSQLVASTNGSRSAASRRFIPFFSYNSLRLEIRDLTAEDSGHYLCWAGNSLGTMASAMNFSAVITPSPALPATLADLHLFKILAGVFIGLVCAAVLCGLVFGIQKNGFCEHRSRWKKWKNKEAGSLAMESKDNSAQLNEPSPETPPSGRLCCYYQRLPMKTGAPPKEASPGQSCTSVL